MSELEVFLDRANGLLDRLEALLPGRPPEPDWQTHAFRWHKERGRGHLQPLPHPQRMELSDLLCLERQKSEIERNTRQFLAGRSANNVLLWGSRGTGKSSLVKALFHDLRGHGLRLIEVAPWCSLAKHALGDLLVTRGRETDGLPYLREALDQTPWNVNVRWSLAHALTRLGLTEQALRLYEKEVGSVDLVLQRARTEVRQIVVIMPMFAEILTSRSKFETLPLIPILLVQTKIRVHPSRDDLECLRVHPFANCSGLPEHRNISRLCILKVRDTNVLG